MSECPPGVHSIFDPCPGNCTENVSAREELYEVLSKRLGERLATSLINEFAYELAEKIRNSPGWLFDEEWMDSRDREHAASLIDPEVKK